MDHVASLYLDLLKRCLTNWIYGDSELEILPPEGFLPPDLGKALAARGIHLSRAKPFDPQLRVEGRDWPPMAHTMVGLKRLDNLQFCVEDVLARNVPGDLMETGTAPGSTSTRRFR